jgi:hypothetical protein
LPFKNGFIIGVSSNREAALIVFHRFCANE